MPIPVCLRSDEEDYGQCFTGLQRVKELLVGRSGGHEDIHAAIADLQPLCGDSYTKPAPGFSVSTYEIPAMKRRIIGLSSQ